MSLPKHFMKHVLIASSNPGKLRDFAAVAGRHGVEVELLPKFESLPECVEDGATFEENARKKAQHYSRHAPGRVVLADDSGIEIDALGGAPGVRSARYAASTEHGNAEDVANNALVLERMKNVPDEKRTGRFVCVIAIARDGKNIATFRGQADGLILRELRGSGGFGYDPMFYFPALQKTFAQVPPEEKAAVSHRGKAFERFLEWCDRQSEL
jgi:XTP/dITP diphosphohydrolase